MSFFGLLILVVIFFLILVPLAILRFVGGLFSGRSKQDRYTHPGNNSSRREGDVFVSDNTPDRQEKIIDGSVGEYVDYEDVEEK